MPYHPQQLLKPCNAGFYYFCKRKREINRDSVCVILSKISTLSTSVIISWKAKRRRGRRKKKEKKEVMGKGGKKKWEFVGGGHCTSAKSEYLKGKWCSQLGTQKLWRCCSQLLQPWLLQLEEKLSQMISVKHPALQLMEGLYPKPNVGPAMSSVFGVLPHGCHFWGVGAPGSGAGAAPLHSETPKLRGVCLQLLGEGVWGHSSQFCNRKIHGQCCKLWIMDQGLQGKDGEGQEQIRPCACRTEYVMSRCIYYFPYHCSHPLIKFTDELSTELIQTWERKDEK